VVTSVIASDGDGTWVEYAGGYSDMVAQRGRGIGKRTEERTAPAANAPARQPAERRAPSRPRLTYADQHALKTLPARIDALHGEIRRLEGVLADTDLYRRDPRTFTEAGAALEAARAEVADAEEAWLSAELRREEVEGS
jgi:ATP-binding cassette subfamily F protein uup